MPKAVYQDIYLDLKRRIEDGGFAYGSFLPSESELTTSYACSRSSIRWRLASSPQTDTSNRSKARGFESSAIHSST